MKKITLISFFLPVLLMGLGKVMPFDSITVLIICFIPMWIFSSICCYLACQMDDSDNKNMFGYGLQSIPTIFGVVLGSLIFNPDIPTSAIIIVAVAFSPILAGPMLFVQYCYNLGKEINQTT